MIKKQHRGAMALIATLLIGVFGFLGLLLTRTTSGSFSASLANSTALQAELYAESGQEYATRSLLNVTPPNLDKRKSCTDLNGESFTPFTTTDGTFTLTNTHYYPGTPTLSAPISSTSTSDININNAMNLASSGHIMLEREIIFYTGLNTSCGGPSSVCLTGVTRGALNSAAQSHAYGTRVAQSQCLVQSVGSVPNASNPQSSKQIDNQYQLQDAWAVGKKEGGLFFAHWDQTKWQAITPSGSPNIDLYDVDMLNPADGIAVGDKNGSSFGLFHWIPSTQSWASQSVIPMPSSAYIKQLRGISYVSSKEAWAVGERGGNGQKRQYTILRWNGSHWCLHSGTTVSDSGSSNCGGSTIPQNVGSNPGHLYDVSVVDINGDGIGNIGFAGGGSGDLLFYNGSSWTIATSPTTRQINTIQIMSAKEAFLGDSAGNLFRWNGTSWSAVSNHLNKVEGLHMIDTNNDGFADAGMAVGSNGNALYYNGSTWVAIACPQKINDVFMFSANRAVAVGQNSKLIHWDGSSWTEIAKPASMNKEIMGVSGSGRGIRISTELKY